MKNLDVGEPTQSTWHTAASSALGSAEQAAEWLEHAGLPLPLESGGNNV